MAIRVALNHKTSYHYDRQVALSPHEVKLRPAAHARTPILAYSLKVTPEDHFVNWQQDPYGNYIARLVFPEKTDVLEIEVDLIADMTAINPFDFFLEQGFEHFPFAYSEQSQYELGPYLQADEPGPLLTEWLAKMRAELLAKPMVTLDFIVAINQRLKNDIDYQLRFEPGVQTPEETLALKCGSCRDTAALLVQILRNIGIAARFVSGYLIQLTADIKAIDGPVGALEDFTDLHAWAELYIPGAGWIGLDATSGMLASEGHIPLACTATPTSAAPVLGFSDKAEVTFAHHMKVTRIHEDPRVTLPYTDEQWAAINQLGEQVDAQLLQDDVRLTQGGEPTFVAIDNVDAEEWNTAADGPHKRQLAGELAQRLQARFAEGSLLQHGQGKWYPGESLPRWALNIYWRLDGEPIWHDQKLLSRGSGSCGQSTADAQRFADALCKRLKLDSKFLMPAYEDVVKQVHFEQTLPVDTDPLSADLDSSEERKRLARLLERGLGAVVGYVLPLQAVTHTQGQAHWQSCTWQLRRQHLYLLEGESPLGLRLPLSSLPWVAPFTTPELRDPFDVHPELSSWSDLRQSSTQAGKNSAAKASSSQTRASREGTPANLFHTAMCFEVRQGNLYVFMPPIAIIEDYLALISHIETTASELSLPLRIEGYTPPRDARVRHLSVTPDPGVIEVNIHPSSSWPELVHTVENLYEEARLTRLGTEKFMQDGRHTGTGGGNHVTLGGATAADSPMLRRPDVLQSLIRYWQNHPSLSYLFSGSFIGPTSQAPRVDEARDDNLYELSIAFQQMDKVLPNSAESEKPWLVDRLLRNLLVDLTGNTHRAEFSIDKLYSPEGSTGRLGLVELRAFEMPPHARMSLVQMLLLRSLIARFWRTPYKQELVHWGKSLHDRWLLPHFVAQDIQFVARDLQQAGFAFDERWFEPFIEFRFPRFGSVVAQGVEMELRQAIEPWHVLGEEMGRGGTARYVDSSVERMQLLVRGMTETRHQVCCNGRLLPLHPTGVPGEFVAAIRFRAWSPYSALHPTIPSHGPLVFDLLDTWAGRSVAGCKYYVSHPGGRSYDDFPVNANAAEARRFSRFSPDGHTPDVMAVPPLERNPHFPLTLDLRWQS